MILGLEGQDSTCFLISAIAQHRIIFASLSRKSDEKEKEKKKQQQESLLQSFLCCTQM